MTGVVIGVVFIVFALALLIPGLLAALGRLPGNNVVGLHVPEVRKDEEIWVQAHKVAGPYLILGGLALAFGSAFAFIADGWLWMGPVVLGVVAVAAVAAAGNQGARAADSSRRRRRTMLTLTPHQPRRSISGRSETQPGGQTTGSLSFQKGGQP